MRDIICRRSHNHQSQREPQHHDDDAAQLADDVLFSFTSGERWGGAYGKMERPRFTVLHPEGSFNASKDIIDRLLLDNMQDEVFILSHTRGLDEETRTGAECFGQHDEAQSAHRSASGRYPSRSTDEAAGGRMEKLFPPALPAHPLT